MARPKSKRNLTKLTLSIDKDILDQARETIDSISLYLEGCLKRHIESEKKKGELRIMDIQSSKNNQTFDAYNLLTEEEKNIHYEELCKSFFDENYVCSDRYYEIEKKLQDLENKHKKSHQYNR